MKKIYTIILCSIAFNASSQTYLQRNFQETIHGLTTIINILKGKPGEYRYSTFGTGFFYHEYAEPTPQHPDGNINSIDSSLRKIWLVTNKHVLFGKENSERLKPPFPVAIDFYLRKKVKNSNIPKWDTIRLKESELRSLTKLHKDSLTDVVAIDVTKYVLQRLSRGDSLFYYGAVSKLNFPSPDMPITLNGFDIGVGQEVLSVGYPQNFYDTYNLFPTVKAGVIASKWKALYNGNRYFLIDSKLFPGSSGSIIVTTPANYGSNKGDFNYFNFLGIYSGEPFRDKKPVEFDDMTIIKRETYNIGIVWYYDLIEEIIKN